MLSRRKLKTDLCVVGGGIAGVCTAVAAAREGIKVVLMQERPVLGGNASSEIRMWICGAQGKNMRETGIVEEIMLKNCYYNPTKNPYIFDNVLLELVNAEKNITLLLNCTCMDAEVESGDYENGRNIKIKNVTGYQMTTQSFFDIDSKFFADCSGDSILAPLTGAEYRTGRESCNEFGEKTHVKEPDNLTMGSTCLIQARETTKKVPFVAPESATEVSSDDFAHRYCGLDKTYENFWYLEMGGNRDTISESEDIAVDLKALSFGTWKHLKENSEYNAENFELEFFGALPGKRESRRYIGEYMMKQQEISKAVKFEDTVAYGGWPIDDHFPSGFFHRGVPNVNLETDAPYPIPYRILYSANVDNLFFAGRNVSATHTANSSLRVMATCGVMGQAAGTAAAIAVKYGLSPHGVYKEKISELKNILMNNDCFLPHYKREISDLCKKTPVKCGNDSLKNGEDRKNIIYGDKECGISVKNGTELLYSFENEEYIKAVHIVFDSDLERETLEGDQCERSHATRSNILLDSPLLHMPKTLCKSFEYKIKYGCGTEEKNVIENNKIRAYHFQLNKNIKSISLTPLSNWGESDTTAVFSFDFS